MLYSGFNFECWNPLFEKGSHYIWWSGEIRLEFHIFLNIITVFASLKPVVTPTKLKLSGAAKIGDIIVPTFRSAGDENCYRGQTFKCPNF
jgi:hypothetical protein